MFFCVTLIANLPQAPSLIPHALHCFPGQIPADQLPRLNQAGSCYSEAIMTDDPRKPDAFPAHFLKLSDMQRFNRALTEIVNEGLNIFDVTGANAANDYMTLNGVPAPVIARVLSHSARKRPR